MECDRLTPPTPDFSYKEGTMPRITMPQLGESVTEGTIGRWLKQPGDRIARDEPLVEVITDKVNAEIPSPVAGVLDRITAAEGVVVAVGQEIGVVVADGEVLAPERTPAAVATTRDAGAEPAPAAAAEGDEDQRRSSPLVRKLAREHSLDLRQVRGTGLGGRITREDVEAYLQRDPAASAGGRVASPAATTPAGQLSPQPGQDERVTLTPMRRAIAQRMAQSAREIPHAWLLMEVDVTRLVRLREEVKEGFRRAEGVDLTYLPFFMKAAVETLRELPVVNATWNDGQIVLKRAINLGVAVALDDGLVVPVIPNADQKSVAGLAHALAEVVGRARASKLSLPDVEGGTFTVNNTGAFGSVASQPIINYPQAAIMNTEAIAKRPVIVDDAIAIRSIMNVCLSFDHRILDGATAGRFLQSIKRRLESWGPGSPLY
ncbi:MAG TPA: dihydrolipoamide acetyltransferase family protein [Chloroflexota bacterium]|nr:dihydrolipoamide acetyltransferase family protein [Chloroflexota bacterium]